MGLTLRSIDDALAACSAGGQCFRSFVVRNTAASSAALTTSGYQTLHRMTPSFTVPTLTAPYTGYYLTSGYLGITRNATADVQLILCKEVLLGTLTVSGNSYADGSAMPTGVEDPGNRTGTLTSAASFCVAYVSVAMTATTPTLTVNYTNQGGTTGRSGTMVFGTNSLADSTFLFTPHLQSGDTGIRDLSASGPNGLSISTGTGGTIKFYGLIPLMYGVGPLATACVSSTPDIFSGQNVIPRLLGGDILSVYSTLTTVSISALCSMILTPDT